MQPELPEGGLIDRKLSILCNMMLTLCSSSKSISCVNSFWLLNNLYNIYITYRGFERFSGFCPTVHTLKNKFSEIWKGIRTLVNIKSSKRTNIKLLDCNNNLVSDPQKMSNTFNDHFSTIGSKIEQILSLGNFKDYFNKKDKMGNW